MLRAKQTLFERFRNHTTVTEFAFSGARQVPYCKVTN